MIRCHGTDNFLKARSRESYLTMNCADKVHTRKCCFEKYEDTNMKVIYNQKGF